MADQVRLKNYLDEAAVAKTPDLPFFTAPPPNVADDADRDEDAAILQLDQVDAAATPSTTTTDVSEHRLYQSLVERLEMISDNQTALASVIIALMEKIDPRHAGADSSVVA